MSERYPCGLRLQRPGDGPCCENQEYDRIPDQDSDELYYRKEGTKIAWHDPGKEYGLQKRNDICHYRVETQKWDEVRQNSSDFNLPVTAGMSQPE